MNSTQTHSNTILLSIPGGAFLGLGLGLFFFPQSVFGTTSVFAFIGCIMGGLGLGLCVAAILGNRQTRQ